MVAVSIGFQRSDDGVADILDLCASFLGFYFHQHLAAAKILKVRKFLGFRPFHHTIGG